MSDVYEKLRACLDNLLTGYPATGSGIEIRILKRLFSEQEAELFMQLSPMPERPLEIGYSHSLIESIIISVTD